MLPRRMAQVHVALTPRDPAPAHVCIAVDCIRATTTIAQALQAGYARVVCVGEIGDARREAAAIGESAVLGGERHGLRVDGFDLGNSPAEYLEPRGTALVLSTTNGTRAILQAALEADHVLTGSLTCLGPVTAAALRLAGDGDIAVRCAGVRGEVALDDVYVAGRFVDALIAGDPSREPTDAARMAQAVARSYAAPLDALAASQSARDLHASGLDDDVARCAAVSTLEVVPRVADLAPGRATVVADP
jgi:2-phosphosulfolactate phosphatase